MSHDPNEDRDPGLYITVRLDHVTQRRDPQYPYRDKVHVETLVDATDQRFSPSVMASLLHALADEVYDNSRRPADLPF